MKEQINFPRAEAFANKLPLDKVLTKDEVTWELYGYTKYNLDPRKLKVILDKYGFSDREKSVIYSILEDRYISGKRNRG